MLRDRSRRPRWWLAVVQVILLIATLAAPAAAANDPSPTQGTQLIQLLTHYKIVKGDDQGNLNLDKPIKRAEMATILVRALGAEQEAQMFAQFTTFTDLQGHWAAGNVTYAAMKGLFKGDGDGRVRPDDYMTNAEAMTLILRLVNLEPSTGTWPVNVLLAASTNGLVLPGVTSANLNDPAVRGAAFQSLAQAISTVKVNGKTFLQNYVAKNPPTLSAMASATSTPNATVRVTGTVSDAESVTVNGNKAALVNGAFSADVSLAYGENKITVVATDLAGNTASSQLTVTRQNPVASIDISGPSRVRPNGTVTYTVSAKDQSGNPIGLGSITANVTGGIGTFNLANGTFTASATSGRGQLVLTAGQLTKTFDIEVMSQDPSVTGVRFLDTSIAPVPYTKSMTVAVQTVNASGNVVDTDYGRMVSLSAVGASGITITPSSVATVAGVATFTVKSAAPGTFTLAASSTGVAGASVTATFGTNLHIQLTADTTSLVVGGLNSMARIRGELRDENNNLVANSTGNPINVTLTSTGTDGAMADTVLTIARGMATSTLSGDDGMFVAGVEGGTATITGVANTSTPMTVYPVSVNVTVPTVGAGTRLAVYGPNILTPGATATYSIRLEDAKGNLIPSNSYAFQIQIDTSNNDPKTSGWPAGVTGVSLGTTGLNPVSDGIAEGATNDGSDVIARTVGGQAYISLQYAYTGKVTITPIPMAATSTAYSSDGVAAAALGSTGFTAVPGSALYQGTPGSILLTADSDALGAGQSAAALPNNGTSSATLRVAIGDVSQHWIPGYTASVRLDRLSGTSTVPPTNLTTLTSDGKASFVVRSTTTAGMDTYQVSTTISGVTYTNTINVYVQNQAPAAATVAAVRGIRTDGSPNQLDLVDADDAYMEIELAPLASEQYVQVKVYPEGYGSPIYTSGGIYINSGAPRIQVPKNVIPSGTRRFAVTVRNGYGTSPLSGYSDPVVNAVYNTGIYINQARYDSPNHKLYLYGAGFTTNPSDTVDPSKLWIYDPAYSANGSHILTLGGAVATVTSYSGITLDVSGVANIGDLDNPAYFSGSDMTINSAAGWYRKSDGTTAAGSTAGKPVTPNARIDSVIYDRTNKRLTINGSGFNTGAIDFNKITLDGTPTNYTLRSLGAYKASDTQIIVPLSSAVMTNLDNATTGNTYVIDAASGWATDGGFSRPAAMGIPLFAQITVYSVSYSSGVVTITGTGFSGTGAFVTVGQMSIVDLSHSKTLPLLGANASIVNDTTITITLTTGTSSQKDAFENHSPDYRGSAIYLQGDQGWFTNGAGREAAPIPTRALRFPTR